MTGHNCDEALERLYEYLDNELDEITAEGIRDHLAACGHCDSGFEFERKLKVIIRQGLSEDVPPRFIAQLRIAIETEALRS